MQTRLQTRDGRQGNLNNLGETGIQMLTPASLKEQLSHFEKKGKGAEVHGVHGASNFYVLVTTHKT
jgi:hypothetical protein